MHTYLRWEGDRDIKKEAIFAVDFLTDMLTGERITAKFYAKQRNSGLEWEVTSQLDTCMVTSLVDDDCK